MGPIVLGLFVALVLILLLALAAPSVAARRLVELRKRSGRTPAPRMSALAFQRLVRDLLTRGMGFEVQSEEVEEGDARLILRRPSPGNLGDVNHVVFIAGDPPGEVVDQAEILELDQTVTALGAASGMLFTPYAIDQTGLPSITAEIEFVDGRRLRQLLASYLPERLHELDGYYGLDPLRPIPNAG